MALLEFLEKNILEISFYVPLAVLAGTAWFEFKRRGFLARHAARIFLYSAGLVFAYLIYLSFLQFRAFQTGPLGLTLGTGSGLRWFLGYIQTHFWNDYLVSLPFAILFVIIAYYFNRKYQDRFFEREEPFLAALGILLTGYPAFLFYIVLVLLLPAIVSAVFVRRGERLPLYHFWMPMAIVVLLIVQFWAQNQTWWSSFRF